MNNDLYSLAVTLAKLYQHLSEHHLSENSTTLEDVGISISNEDIESLYGK